MKQYIYRNIYAIYKYMKGYWNYLNDYRTFIRISTQENKRFSLNWKERYPCLGDKTPSTDFGRHYVYHTAWAARVLAETRPASHVDISSCLRFIGVISAFINVKFYDYRPPNIALSNLAVDHADLTTLKFDDKSISSLSCMHVVEHIGLGRYGDALDYNGDIKAINELKRVLSPNGDLLFVVPVGKPKIQYNAHRIYSYDQVIDCFSDFKLVEFSLIPDDENDGGLIRNAPKEFVDEQSFGCGCFWFKKEHIQ